MNFPDLPLTPRLEELRQTVAAHQTVLLMAQPGAGKSTLVPPALLPLVPAGKKILLLEPRRLAAVACAARISEIIGSPLGHKAGFRVRGESKTTPQTAIEVITEGILIRMLQDDPGLQETAIVCFDEFHERSLSADLGLALIQDTLELRPDLKVIVMSATLEKDQLLEIFPKAPVMEVQTRAFPVEEVYFEHPVPGDNWEPVLAQWCRQILNAYPGDMLVFLPGSREIRQVQSALTGTMENLQVLTLTGQMDLQDQQKVLHPSTPRLRRVILSTSVAETSLTIEGIKIVVDSGLSRLGRLDKNTGLDQLYTVPVSDSSAKQRKGRAGRTSGGTVFRFWPKNQPLSSAPEPEIHRVDLTQVVLDCHLWGAKNPGDLKWISPPSLDRWNAARSLLVDLEALDTSGFPTPLAKTMARLGIAPRLAAMIIRQNRPERTACACACAAVLAAGPSPKAGTVFSELFDQLLDGRDPWAFKARTEYRMLADKAGLKEKTWAGEGVEKAGVLLVQAYPERLCRQVQPGLFQSSGGRQLRLEGPLAIQKLLVAVEADSGSVQGRIFRAEVLDPLEVETALASHFKTEKEYRWEKWELKVLSVKKFGVLEWSRTPLPRPSPDQLGEIVLKRLEAEGMEALPWTPASLEFLQRCRLGAKSFDGPWIIPQESGPPGEIPWILQGIQDRGPVMTEESLLNALQNSLDYSQRQHLDKTAPASLVVPSKSRRAIHYPPQGAPWLEVRIQEIFGMDQSPVIAGQPLVIHLLSPAQRPLQVTSDLASFWKNTYPEVRKDMRGRYPRHYWPENPLEAEPTARAKPRGT